MNLVGKIFVFLIFCMSLVFMAFSVMIYATHKNWKDEVLRTEPGPRGEKIGWKKQLEDEKQKNLALQSQKRTLEDKIATQEAAKRQAIAKLEAEKERLQQERDAYMTTYITKVAELSDRVTAVKDQQVILENLRSENLSMRGEIKTARGVIDNKFSELLVMTEQNHQAKGELIRLEDRKKQLLKDLEQAERVLTANNLTKDASIDGIPPAIDGIITRVQKHKDDTFVEITVGSDDGIQMGHVMEVFRGGKYLGQVEIVRTTPDKAVGKVDIKRQQGEIRARDRVETRRNLKLTAG